MTLGSIALVFIVAAILAVMLELLARDARRLSARAQRLKDLAFREVAKYEVGEERKRLR